MKKFQIRYKKLRELGMKETKARLLIKYSHSLNGYLHFAPAIIDVYPKIMKKFSQKNKKIVKGIEHIFSEK